jgi:hypothetical protein
MKILSHAIVDLALHSHYYKRYEIYPVLYFPKGGCFSLSGLSPESENKNLLCALCVSSEAGGENV